MQVTAVEQEGGPTQLSPLLAKLLAHTRVHVTERRGEEMWRSWDDYSRMYNADDNLMIS